MAVDNVKHLLALGRRRQVLVPVLGNEDVVLDADAPDAVVSFEDFLVDELGVRRVVEEVALNVLAAEIAVCLVSNSTHPTVTKCLTRNKAA